jgi:hypothetical protein
MVQGYVEETLNLSGVSITDNPDEPEKFVFPAETSIEPGEYLVLYADSDAASSGVHLGFALDKDGDGLYLYNSSGQLLDSVEFGDMSHQRALFLFEPLKLFSCALFTQPGLFLQRSKSLLAAAFKARQAVYGLLEKGPFVIQDDLQAFLKHG